MTIKQYLQNILEEQGFDAYSEESDRLIDLRNEDLDAWIEGEEQDLFGDEIARLGICEEGLNDWLMGWAE